MRRQQITVAPTAWQPNVGRSRILIEHRDTAIALAMENLLASEGYSVSRCGGPTDRLPCALVRAGSCERTEQADVIIFGLEIIDRDDRAVLERLKTQKGGSVVIVEVPARHAPFYREELAGCIVVARPVTRGWLLQAVADALL